MDFDMALELHQMVVMKKLFHRTWARQRGTYRPIREAGKIS